MSRMRIILGSLIGFTASCLILLECYRNMSVLTTLSGSTVGWFINAGIAGFSIVGIILAFKHKIIGRYAVLLLALASIGCQLASFVNLYPSVFGQYTTFNGWIPEVAAWLSFITIEGVLLFFSGNLIATADWVKQ